MLQWNLDKATAFQLIPLFSTSNRHISLMGKQSGEESGHCAYWKADCAKAQNGADEGEGIKQTQVAAWTDTALLLPKYLGHWSIGIRSQIEIRASRYLANIKSHIASVTQKLLYLP